MFDFESGGGTKIPARACQYQILETEIAYKTIQIVFKSLPIIKSSIEWLPKGTVFDVIGEMATDSYDDEGVIRAMNFLASHVLDVCQAGMFSFERMVSHFEVQLALSNHVELDIPNPIFQGTFVTVEDGVSKTTLYATFLHTFHKANDICLIALHIVNATQTFKKTELPLPISIFRALQILCMTVSKIYNIYIDLSNQIQPRVTSKFFKTRGYFERCGTEVTIS